MNEVDNLHRGIVLMKQALKKYEEEDFESADKDRKLANEFFDKAQKEINTDEYQLSQLYGESRNFGIIYNVFEQNINKLLESTKKQKAIKEFYQTIKNDKILTEEFKIYDCFEKGYSDSPNDFVNETLDMFQRFNKNIIKTKNQKLIDIIKKYKLNEFVYIPEKLENLYESIEFLILNKKTINNIDDIIKAKKCITEHIETNKENSINEEKNISIDDFIEKLTDKQEDINNKLNEEEAKLLNLFSDKNINHKQLFENYKSNTMKQLNKALNECTDDEEKVSWESFIENISNKKFSEVNNDINVSNCAEMLEICSTLK